MDASFARCVPITGLFFVAILFGSSAQASGPSPAAALRLKPIQTEVDFDLPDDEEIERVTVQAHSEGGVAGWHVYNAAGQLLRRFLDTNRDNRLDMWCYYKGGVEVYRDIDSDFNGKADQYRWLGTAGSRWGVDENENGQIDYWKMISAEEVSAEVVAALRDRDEARFTRLLPTQEELDSLGLGERQAAVLADQIAGAAENFGALAAQQRVVGENTRWVHFGASPPGVQPAGFEGSVRDLMVYDNVSAIVETGGTTDQIAIGTLVQVESGWRVLDLPRSLGEETTADVVGGFFFQQVASAAPESGAAAGGLSETMQQLLRQLEQVDNQLARVSSPAEMAPLHEQRARILEQLASESGSAEEEETWLRQYADTLSAAVQAGEFPGGLARLQNLTRQLEQREAGSELAAFVRFRFMNADYGQNIQQPDADFAAIQEQWREDLLQFVSDYPQSDETAEAMLQLAVGEEFDGQTEQAIEWYSRIVNDFGDSPQTPKAGGAIRRLESEGNVLTLAGTTLDGKSVSLEDFRGRTVLVHYWATWCEPCKQDMSVLRQMLSKYRQEGFAIIGVNLDSNEDTAKQYLQSQTLPWPQLYEPGGLDSRLATEMGILTLPTMFLVDPEGRVTHRNIYAAQLDRELGRIFR